MGKIEKAINVINDISGICGFFASATIPKKYPIIAPRGEAKALLLVVVYHNKKPPQA